MNELSKRQRQILNAIIEETRIHGPPTYGRVRELTGVADATCRQAIGRLKSRGYIAQDYRTGPYRPVRTPDGFRLELLVKMKTPNNTPDAPNEVRINYSDFSFYFQGPRQAAIKEARTALKMLAAYDRMQGREPAPGGCVEVWDGARYATLTDESEQ